MGCACFKLLRIPVLYFLKKKMFHQESRKTVLMTPPSQVGDVPANRRSPCRSRYREERKGKRDEGRDKGGKNYVKIIRLSLSRDNTE